MKAGLWGALLLLGMGALFLWLLQSPEEEVARRAEEEKPAILTSIELKDYEGSQLKVQLFAKEAQVLEKAKTTDLFGVYGVIFSEDPAGEPTKLWANRAKLSGNTKLMTLIGDVRMEFPQGRVLLTQILVYDQAQDLLWGDQRVRLIGRGDSVEAEGMKYLLQKERLTLARPLIEVEL